MEAYSLKDKEKGMEQVYECTVLSSSSSFFYPFLFSFLFSPLFFVSRRDRSTSVSFCSPLFFFIYLPFSLQPPPNERRKNDNILLPSRTSSPPEPLDSPACFVCILIDPRLRFTRTFWPAPTTSSLVSFHLHAPG